MSKSQPLVSVVIPAYNEATYIDRLLEALTKQTYGSFEVVVSDAMSDDDTKKVIDRFARRLSIKLVESEPRGPAAGRNVGAQMAKGTWLLFLDADDDLDDPSFIGTLLDKTIQNNWQTASTKVRVQDGTMIERLGLFLNYRYIKLLAHTKHPVAPGWCILTNRSVFEKAGGFNEKFHFGEDYEYVNRVGRHGFGFVDSTYYFVDLRRPREEGLSFLYKVVANEIYRHWHRYSVEGSPYAYTF